MKLLKTVEICMLILLLYIHQTFTRNYIYKQIMNSKGAMIPLINKNMNIIFWYYYIEIYM